MINLEYVLLAELPRKISFEVESKSILITHAVPNQPWEVFYPDKKMRSGKTVPSLFLNHVREKHNLKRDEIIKDEHINSGMETFEWEEEVKF